MVRGLLVRSLQRARVDLLDDVIDGFLDRDVVERRFSEIEAREALAGELTPAHTPLGDTWILSEDETTFRTQPRPPAPARLLPSGDTYYLLWGADRKLLVPQARQRASLWTTRVWPGALLLDG